MVEKIVEQKDATQEQKKINEINSGIYFFEVDDLLWSLDLLTDDNAQKNII
jgi:bifunctional UDP-N-acetylglucosamine pyrophosphorylase/glucosamine-1-phosphate N-acetyltransferase